MSRSVTPRPWTRLVARASALGLVVAGLAWGGVALTSAACTNTVTTNASLVSGFFINSQLLLDDGNLGCSNDNDLDVYKYVAVAINDRNEIAGAGIFDCYADGVFANLPGIDSGLLDFAVWIYAYNPSAYATANAGNKLVTAVGQLGGVNTADGGFVPVPSTIVPDGGSNKTKYAAALSVICTSQATWVATCSATSQASVQNLAFCGALQLETTVPTACNLPVLLPDASVDARAD